MADPSSDDLERLLLRALTEAWEWANDDDFGQRLRPPTLALHDGEALGWFRTESRTLSLQRTLCWEAPWVQVVEVLRHEMAHQYVHEVLGITDEAPHGPAFRKVCQARGIDAGAAGLPMGRSVVDDRIVSRIRGLFALSGSDNPHEASAAARAAARLLARHDLTRADLEGPAVTFRQLGAVKGRFDAWEKVLGGIVGAHFGVRTIWVTAYRPSDGVWGRALEAVGPAHHLEVAAYVHEVLAAEGERLWRAHKARRGLRGNRERRRFLLGVMIGVREALEEERVEARQAGRPEALVAAEHAPTVRLFQLRHPRIRSGAPSRARVSPTTAHGLAAGRQVRIRPGVGGRADAPRGLPGPSEGGS